jgi:alkylated DNA repair dioxygenase AlkB
MNKLFEINIDSKKNWLPYDGTVHYWGTIFSSIQNKNYITALLEEITWKNDEAIIFGKHIITKRKVAWYADQPHTYTYSKISRTALLWTPLLLEIKKIVESKTGQHYNSCLLNLYHNGSEGMTWHSDDEKDLKQNSSIASLTLGAKRKFAIKHKKTKYKQVFELESGDLLEMKDETQTHWLHNVPVTKKVSTPRINLTFRQIEKL